jgi:site-specific DNA-methyltransferase (adenine-specific)
VSQASLLTRAEGAIDPAAVARAEIVDLDAVELLRRLPDGSIDLVVTDPAYESLEKHRAVGTTTRLKKSAGSSNAWFPIFPNARFHEFFRELYRVMKPASHVYFFCDQETMFVAKPIGESAGFKFWKPIVWDKLGMGMGYHYRAQYELILFFEKGKRKLANLGVSDVIREPRVRNGYPTEKPPRVAQLLIEQSSRPGDIVLDPFCGSGSTGEAALRVGRRFLGGDIESGALARARVEHDWGAQGPLLHPSRHSVARETSEVGNG